MTKLPSMHGAMGCRSRDPRVNRRSQCQCQCRMLQHDVAMLRLYAQSVLSLPICGPAFLLLPSGLCTGLGSIRNLRKVYT